MKLNLFGRSAATEEVPVSFPTVSNLTGIVSFEEEAGGLVDLYLATNRKQVDRSSMIGQTIGKVFTDNYGGSAPTAYVMLKGSVSTNVNSSYVLTESDVLELSQIKSTSQAASLA